MSLSPEGKCWWATLGKLQAKRRIKRRGKQTGKKEKLARKGGSWIIWNVWKMRAQVHCVPRFSHSNQNALCFKADRPSEQVTAHWELIFIVCACPWLVMTKRWWANRLFWGFLAEPVLKIKWGALLFWFFQMNKFRESAPRAGRQLYRCMKVTLMN